MFDLYCFVAINFSCWDRVLCSPFWPRSCYIAELLIILLSPSVCWDCKHPPLPLVYRHTSIYQHDQDIPYNEYAWFPCELSWSSCCVTKQKKIQNLPVNTALKTFTLNQFMLSPNNNTTLLFLGCFKVIKDSVSCVFSSRLKHGTVQSCVLSSFSPALLCVCVYVSLFEYNNPVWGYWPPDVLLLIVGYFDCSLTSAVSVL